MSDHELVTIDLGYNLCEPAEPSPDDSIPEHQATRDRLLSQFNFTNANFEKISKQLNNIDWDNLNGTSSEEDFVDAFYDKIFEICKSNVPLKKLKKSGNMSKNTSDNLTTSTLNIPRILSRKRRKIKKRLNSLNAFQPYSPSIQILVKQT